MATNNPKKANLPLGQKPEDKGQAIDKIAASFKTIPAKKTADKESVSIDDEIASKKKEIETLQLNLKSGLDQNLIDLTKNSIDEAKRDLSDLIIKRHNEESKNPFSASKIRSTIKKSSEIDTKNTPNIVQTKSNNAPKPTTPNIFNPKSKSDQLLDLQLKQLKKRIQQENALPGFKLPKIPKDTATEIVIGSLAATFIILAGISTKFSQLWGYAFNSPTGSGVGDFQGTGPGYQELGAGYGDEAWGIPDIFHSSGVA